MYAVIGLGNPGTKYKGTRHNVGFDTIDCLAQRNNTKITKIKFKSLYGETQIGNEKVLLVKPQTYMNRSGESVLEISKFYKLPIENIIVIVDDVDIKFGSLRIRAKGSAGTHNGLKSIIYLLQSENFPRVKIGVGKPNEHQDLADFVLSGFSKEHRVIIDNTVEQAAKAVEKIITSGISAAMNEFNINIESPGI
ncbi:peptidyl-tRNA hydrolase, PTH1 family [Proteiniborus sp. DW1]|uniref:aminoacyl-tRNA hydrolase n=1 Tax=Proteiniborus sp. DW1 TaxID=1889883 RepID=UPI00092DF623|nr:aminoacyl-tRNA hydrolase [Proteiniborus sp. DW1]SCG84234.1 peptidyl-tRNA hydrolase, PTH1 family [Proteiniborus sp. DW1]